MELSKEEYFFYEWLIIGKQMTKEEFKQLTPLEFSKLITEYKEMLLRSKE